jgi:adenylate cyclase class IV
VTVEREVKAVAPDPAAVRARLLAAGAVPRFRGMMLDRRFDAAGALTARDEVLRVRRYRSNDGRERAVLAWKGPVSVDGGHKLRREHEVTTADGEAAAALVAALGYAPVHAIDRYVEYYDVEGAVVRLEWYPRMDALIEVEGGADSIERAIAATGVPREAFTAEALLAFQQRFELRTGRPAAVTVEQLGDEAPSWEGIA